MEFLWAAIIQFATLLVAIVGLWRLVRETKQANLRLQQQATVNYIMTTIQRQHELYSKINLDEAFAAKAMNVDSIEFHELTSYMAYLEYLAAGVNMKIMDVDVVNRTIGSRIITATETYGPWIAMEKERLRRSSTSIYQELDDLVEELRTIRRGTPLE